MEYRLSLYIGSPGSGKSTLLAYLCRKSIRHRRPCYSNYYISDTFRLDPHSDLGYFDISDSDIFIDEAGLEYDNRRFKTNFSDNNVLEFFKTFRHYKDNIFVFSQGLDVDLKIRTLATNIYLVKKSLIPCFTRVQRVKKKIGVDEMTKDLVDQYVIVPFSGYWIFRPFYYKYFDSFDTKVLPHKEFDKW